MGWSRRCADAWRGWGVAEAFWCLMWLLGPLQLLVVFLSQVFAQSLVRVGLDPLTALAVLFLAGPCALFCCGCSDALMCFSSKSETSKQRKFEHGERPVGSVVAAVLFLLLRAVVPLLGVPDTPGVSVAQAVLAGVGCAAWFVFFTLWIRYRQRFAQDVVASTWGATLSSNNRAELEERGDDPSDSNSSSASSADDGQATTPPSTSAAGAWTSGAASEMESDLCDVVAGEIAHEPVRGLLWALMASYVLQSAGSTVDVSIYGAPGTPLAGWSALSLMFVLAAGCLLVPYWFSCDGDLKRWRVTPSSSQPPSKPVSGSITTRALLLYFTGASCICGAIIWVCLYASAVSPLIRLIPISVSPALLALVAMGPAVGFLVISDRFLLRLWRARQHSYLWRGAVSFSLVFVPMVLIMMAAALPPSAAGFTAFVVFLAAFLLVFTVTFLLRSGIYNLMIGACHEPVVAQPSDADKSEALSKSCANTCRSYWCVEHRLLSGSMGCALTAALILLFLVLFTTTFAYFGPLNFLEDMLWLTLLICAILTTAPLLLRPVMVKLPGNSTVFAAQDDRDGAGFARRHLGSLVRLGVLCVMILVLFICVVATDTSGREFPDRDSSDTLIRVAVWNVHLGFGREGEFSMSTQLERLRTLESKMDGRLDFVFLQESETARFFTGNYDIVTYLAFGMGMYAYHGAPSSSGSFGAAVLSRWPLSDQAFTLLDNDGQKVPFTEAVASVPCDKDDADSRYWDVGLISTHIDGCCGTQDDQTRLAMSELRDRFSGDFPVLLGTDLNARPTDSKNDASRVIVGNQYCLPNIFDSPLWCGIPSPGKLLTDVWHHQNNLQDPTSPFNHYYDEREKYLMATRIDYLFASSDFAVKDAWMDSVCAGEGGIWGPPERFGECLTDPCPENAGCTSYSEGSDHPIVVGVLERPTGVC